MPLAIAIIGAGVSGLSCARALLSAGHAVTVFEKSSAPGGRAATRRTELGGFDHGAQYFTARHAEFSDEVQAWIAAGVAEQWSGRIVSLSQGRATPMAGATQRYVGTPGMSAIGAWLGDELDVRLEQRVTRIERIGEGSSARWSLQRLSDVNEPDGLTVTEGLYDVVVVAVPADQAIDLLAPAPALAATAGNARLAPCWALMLAFTEPLDLSWDGAFSDGPRLAWMARESSKPGRRSGERWVAHATPAWSIEHLDDDPEDVKTKLLKAFHECTHTTAQPIHAVVHRWRFSIPPQALAQEFLWDGALRLGACGDWCGGPRLEGAWLSGQHLARAIGGA